MTYFLSVFAQFKDEELILGEWIDHYMREGAEHFFLIDDGSTDGSQRLLRPYVSKGLVTLMRDVRKDHVPPVSMVERYNLLLKPFLHSSVWVIHVDLDEFIYGRRLSVAQYLHHVDADVGEIKVPWKIFASSGHVRKPPLGIAQGFLWRHNFSNEFMAIHTKCVYRTSALVKLGVHSSEILPRFRSGFPYPKRVGDPEGGNTSTAASNEQALNELALHLNHYAIRWKDWFMKVKATRGTADRDVNVYNDDYFNAFDRNEVLDDELSQISESAAREQVATGTRFAHAVR